MIDSTRRRGGRGYAIAAAAIAASTLVCLLYLAIVAFKLDPVTADAFAPLAWYFAGIAGIGGAMQLPNTAERWRGSYTPYPSPTNEELP